MDLTPLQIDLFKSLIGLTLTCTMFIGIGIILTKIVERIPSKILEKIF